MINTGKSWSKVTAQFQMTVDYKYQYTLLMYFIIIEHILGSDYKYTF